MFVKRLLRKFTLLVLLAFCATAILADNSAITYLFDQERGLTVPDLKVNLDAYLGCRDISSSIPCYSNIVKFPYKNNHSLKFTGKGFGNKAFSIPESQTGASSSFTLEAWVKPETKMLAFTRIWTKEGLFSLSTKLGKNKNTRLVWGVNINGKLKKMATPVNMKIFTVESDKSFSWVHIATSYNSKNGMAKIFINGKIAVQANLGKLQTKVPQSPLIVGNRAKADRGFIGLIDEFRFSKHSLDISELAYNKTLFATTAATKTIFEWENSICGISDKVPARWKSIKTINNPDKSIVVIVADKKIIFSNSIIPDKIQINGLELLSSPVILEKDGLNNRKFRSNVKIVKKSNKKVTLEGEISIAKQRFKGRCEIEFDGLCRVTFEPILNSPRPKVSSLRLKFLLNPKIAKLGKIGGFAGEIKNKVGKNWTFPLWIGIEKGGLTVFTDTNEFWVNPKPKEAFTVIPKTKNVEVSVNFISAPTVFKPNSKFEFFFQPTPVATFPEKRPELGNFHGAFINMEKTPGAVNLSYPAKTNLNLNTGSFDIVFEAAFDPNVKMNKLIGREPYIRELFTIGTLGHEKFRLAWSIAHGGFIVDEGVQPSAKSIWDGTWKTLFVSKFSGKANTPYHLTLTWGKEYLKLFINGKLLKKHLRNGLLSSKHNPDSTGKMNIRIGESIFNFLTPRFGSGIKVDAIRILDRELSSKEIGAPLKKVKGTLLLDSFNSSKRLGNEIITKPQVGASGHIAAGGKILNNKVQLFQDLTDIKASCLDRVHESGVTTIIFHQGWSSIQSHYKAEYPKELRELIKACHKKKMKILLYFGFELSEKAPEFKKFHRKVLRLHSDRPTPPLYKVRYDQKSQTVCYAGVWQDFITFAIDKTLKDFNCDGIYIDAAMVPYPCPNKLHGCGWRDSSGRLHATQPIYSYVKMMRRIHNIVKARGGTITGNQATQPLWPYCDSVWMGEGYRYKQLGENPIKGIPLAQWRILFSGVNLGMPGELLMYEYPRNWRRDTAWMLAGLHNIYVRPEIWWNGTYLEKVLAIRKAISKYASSSAKFIPYWTKEVPVKTKNNNILISAWESPKTILLWIGNTSEKRIKSEFIFDNKISQKIKGEAFDPIFKNRYKIKNNLISLFIEPFNFRLICINKR